MFNYLSAAEDRRNGLIWGRDGLTFLPDCETAKNAQILHFTFDDICTVRHELLHGAPRTEAYKTDVRLVRGTGTTPWSRCTTG
jgi:hypothetical protein